MKTRRKEILGDILRREIVIRRISQETLGNVVGLGKTAISAYELGKASPDIEKLDMMCFCQCPWHKKRPDALHIRFCCIRVPVSAPKTQIPMFRRKLKRECQIVVKLMSTA